MGLVLLILAVILVVAGAVELLQGALVLGIVLIIAGALLGAFGSRTPTPRV